MKRLRNSLEAAPDVTLTEARTHVQRGGAAGLDVVRPGNLSPHQSKIEPHHRRAFEQRKDERDESHRVGSRSAC